MDDLSSTIDRRHPPSYHVVQYIEHYLARQDGRLFASVRLVGDGKEIRDVGTGRMHNTAVSAWIR